MPSYDTGHVTCGAMNTWLYLIVTISLFVYLFFIFSCRNVLFVIVICVSFVFVLALCFCCLFCFLLFQIKFVLNFKLFTKVCPS